MALHEGLVECNSERWEKGLSGEVRDVQAVAGGTSMTIRSCCGPPVLL